MAFILIMWNEQYTYDTMIIFTGYLKTRMFKIQLDNERKKGVCTAFWIIVCGVAHIVCPFKCDA